MVCAITFIPGILIHLVRGYIFFANRDDCTMCMVRGIEFVMAAFSWD